MILLSFPRASLKASMLPVSTFFTSSITLLTAANFTSFSSSCLSRASASSQSEASKLAASAAASASFKASMVPTAQAFPSCSRAFCRVNAALACLIKSLSTPASFACCIANFKPVTLPSSISLLSSVSAFSLDSAQASTAWNSAVSLLSTPAFWASASAALSSSMLPLSAAACSFSRAACLSSSSASTPIASSSFAPVTLASSALVIAFLSLRISLSAIA
mmetsp:Transcript_58554/g.110179  ORF Transcript_58554/g.110179 Transcript_58554/m.110179 type:complete len:220 (-) Transcript_58554:1841-2500(-)